MATSRARLKDIKRCINTPRATFMAKIIGLISRKIFTTRKKESKIR